MRKPNVSRLSLKSLRDHVNATTLDVALPDDDGDVHAMVYVPRFTVPVGLVAPSVPSQDLHLGGFLVDKFPASAIEYVGGIDKAASRPLAAPRIVLSDADQVVGRRTFGGSPVSLMSVREWGHLGWLSALLGHTLKGNTQGRRDARDPDEWPSYADRFGATDLTVPGTGPLSWSHNGLPSGIVDLLGNLMHYLAVDGAAPGSLLVIREAVLSEPGGINDIEGDFQISNPSHTYDSWYSFTNWPATNGLLRIDDELLVYESLTIDGGDPSIAHLVNCTRAQYGTSAVVHNEDAHAQLERWHVVAPGSYTGALGSAIDADDTEIVVDWGAAAHGQRDAEPTVGDVLCLEGEDVRVDQVVGATLTVTRGHNATTPGPHDAGVLFAKYPTTMTRASQGYVTGYAAGALRTHVDLEQLYLPAATQTSAPAGVASFIQFRLNSAAAWYLLRGASSARNAAESQLAMQLLADSTLPSGNQFRCVFYVS